MKQIIEKIIDLAPCTGVLTPKVPTTPPIMELVGVCDITIDMISSIGESAVRGDVLNQRENIAKVILNLTTLSIELGLVDDLVDDLFAIQRSTATQFDTSEDRAKETQAHYKGKNRETYYRKVGELFVTYCKLDDTSLKSKYFTEIKLKE